MGALGVVAVGFVGLVLLLAAGLYKAVKRRRRPAHPRTVADLVSIRQSQGQVDTDTPDPVAVTPAAPDRGAAAIPVAAGRTMPPPDTGETDGSSADVLEDAIAEPAVPSSSEPTTPISAATSAEQPTSAEPAAEVDSSAEPVLAASSSTVGAASAETEADAEPQASVEPAAPPEKGTPSGEAAGDPASSASANGRAPTPRPRPVVAPPTPSESAPPGERTDVAPVAVAPIGDGPPVAASAAEVLPVVDPATEGPSIEPVASVESLSVAETAPVERAVAVEQVAPVGRAAAGEPPSSASARGRAPTPHPRPVATPPTPTEHAPPGERTDAAPATVAPIGDGSAVVDSAADVPSVGTSAVAAPAIVGSAAEVPSVDGSAAEVPSVDSAAPDVPVETSTDPVAQASDPQTSDAQTSAAPVLTAPVLTAETSATSIPISSVPSAPLPGAPIPAAGRSDTPAAASIPVPEPRNGGAPEPVVVVPEQRGLPAATTEDAVGPRTVGGRPSGSRDRAEPTPVDHALLRTFGVAGPGSVPDPEDEGTALSVRHHEAPPASAGSAAPVTFRVVGRDGSGIADATVTLHDDRGREAASAPSDEAGQGALSAPHPGNFVLVTAARGFQPGATALTVGAQAAHVEILLTRGASICGTVRGNRGPQSAVRVVLVQDGEAVDAVSTGQDGGYRFAGLAAGRYGVSATAEDRAPAAVIVALTEEQQAQHDIDLGPVDLPRHDVVTSGC